MAYSDSAGNIWWPHLCGNKTIYNAFWSDGLTVNTTNPDFTECFQKSVLIWAPAGWMILCSLFMIPFYRSHVNIQPKGYASTLCKFKTILGVLLTVTGLCELFEAVARDRDDNPENDPELVEFIGYTMRSIALLMATIFIRWGFRKGFHTSGILFLFWFVSTLFGIVPFRSKILRAQEESLIENKFQFIVFYIYFGLVAVEFILSFWADKDALYPGGREGKGIPRPKGESEPLIAPPTPAFAKQKNPNPRESCSFFSFLFFGWFSGIVFRGYKRTLEYADIWDIRGEDSSEVIVETFEREWDKELEKCGYIKREGGCVVPDGSGRHETMRPSLLKALVRSFGAYYSLAGLVMVLQVIFQLLNPQIMNALITFVSGDDPFVWRGYVYAVGMFCSSIMGCLFMHHGFNMGYTTGMRVRTAVITAIYRKTLRVSASSKTSKTGDGGGQITNLMSVDAQKLQDAPQFLHYIWIAPLEVVFACYFLWQKIGIACLAGLAFLVLVLPFNTIALGRKMRQYQIRQMGLKDSRIKLMNQVLAGIKVLKLYAWEPFFEQRIQGIRHHELVVLTKAAILGTINYIISFSSNFIVALVCFVTYIYTTGNGILPPDVAFVSLSLLGILSMPIMIIPMCVMNFVQGMVSLKRINDFLLQEEVDTDNVQHDYTAEEALTIQNGTFSWGTDRTILEDIDLSVKDGQLIAVVGQVGCGKSSLLSAMLGEMVRHSGKVNLKGSVAFVPQQAWIQNMTLKDNILFAKPFIQDKYEKIMDACALTPDLKILAAGDQTEIGERGINLSGGQKQRVSLARALYQDADVYLLDDPLSAVDSHVGKHIYEKVIGNHGHLKHKTRVFVTNAITFLPKVDVIVVMNEGRITEVGGYEELLEKNGAFADYANTYLAEMDDDESDDEESEQIRQDLQRRISRLTSGDDTVGSTSEGEGRKRSESTVRRRKSSARRISRVEKDIEEEKEHKKKALIVEETAEEGNIKPEVLKAYIQAGTIFWTIMCVAGLGLNVGGVVGNNIWLSEWSNDSFLNVTEAQDRVSLRLGVYASLGIVQALGIFMLAASTAMGCLTASRKLHNALLSNTLKNPMSFFDTTPLGRIINRFSKDVDTLDSELRMFIQSWLSTVSTVIASIVIIIYSTPIFVVVVIPLVILFAILQRVYVTTARQMKRIDSIRRSPIYANFSETLNGVGSIRAYQQQDRFIKNADILLDNNQKVWFAVFSSNRWISIWAEMLGDSIVLFAAIFIVLQRESLDPGTVGLSLSFAMQVSFQIVMTVRASCELETYIVSVERVKEYTETPTEAAWIVDDCRPALGWPDEGQVEFSNYSTRYREGLDLVMKDIDCVLQPGEKVGIVGRTGAGKSSLTLALFRLIEAAGGKIIIDGQDIAQIGLHDLRSKVTIIPQDPVLFSGTLRFNLDPADKYSDDEVWVALQQAHLKAFVSSLKEQLEYECGEDGVNLSVGQRQLVCLARALLRKSRILVLDEATAAIDLETDDLIQNTIRTEFKGCTVLTIAHRLNTIMDYDRILVMDKGLVKEYDSPTALLENSESIFYGMARDANLV